MKNEEFLRLCKAKVAEYTKLRLKKENQNGVKKESNPGRWCNY